MSSKTYRKRQWSKVNEVPKSKWEADFRIIQKILWDVIEDIHRNNVNNENLGWEKGVYPSDDFIQNSLTKGELYTLTEKDTLYACVILNSEHNEGYDKCTWSITCDSSQVLTPHALAVNQRFRKRHWKNCGKEYIGYCKG
ncbi:MAG: hypothetical protein ACLTS6_21860 [Anaerobutyricum sp.]